MTTSTSSGSSGDPVRLGIIGVGTLTLRALLPHLCGDDLDGVVSVTALCDPVHGRAADAAAAYGVAKAYQSIDELVADDDVDAVTLVSPIGLHAAHGKTALSVGKHVHFNKTMSTTVAEADELIDLAVRKGLRIGHQHAADKGRAGGHVACDSRHP
jgi:predicted dehydrogenase